MDNLFKALGDENRLRIINLLTKDELCVCELEALLGTTQSNISRHLSTLRNLDIVTFEKKAQWTYYQISPSFIKDNDLLYKYLIDKMDNIPVFIKDVEQLNLYKKGEIYSDIKPTQQER